MTVGLFLYDQYSTRYFLKGEFLKTQELCSQSLAQCSNKETLDVLNKYKDLINDFYVRGRRAAEGKRYNEARYFYDLVKDTDSEITKKVSFWYEYSFVLEAQIDYGSNFDAYREAKNALLNAHQLDRSDTSVLYRLSYLSEKMGLFIGDKEYFIEALDFCDKILVIKKDDWNGIMCKANMYFYLGDVDNTKKYLMFALELYPNNIETIIAIGLFLYYQEDHTNSYAMLKQLSNIDKKNFPSIQKYYRVKIIQAMNLKALGKINRSDEQVLQACKDMENIKKEIDFKEFRWDNLDLNEVNVTVVSSIDCDGNNLLYILSLIQEVPNVGKCNDPYDKLLDDKCAPQP